MVDIETTHIQTEAPQTPYGQGTEQSLEQLSDGLSFHSMILTHCVLQYQVIPVAVGIKRIPGRIIACGRLKVEVAFVAEI